MTVQYLRNQNITKQSQFVPYTEIFPYLQANPDWIEHPEIRKAAKVLNGLQMPEQLKDFSTKILEEIGIQRNKPDADQDKFFIKRLQELYKETEDRFQAAEFKQLTGETA